MAVLHAFDNATMLSNATGSAAVQIKFSEDRIRASNGAIVAAGTEASVNAQDGEIFLKVKE